MEFFIYFIFPTVHVYRRDFFISYILNTFIKSINLSAAAYKIYA